MSDRGKTLRDEAGNNAICPSGNRASEGEGLSRRGRRPEEEKKRRPNLRSEKSIEERRTKKKKRTSARREKERDRVFEVVKGGGGKGSKKGSASAFSFIIREKTEEVAGAKGKACLEIRRWEEERAKGGREGWKEFSLRSTLST